MTNINVPTYSMSADYTITIDAVESVNDASVELMKKLQESIDQEILHEVFKSAIDNQDWTTVVVGYNVYKQVTDEWLDVNMQGDYHCFDCYWYFKNQSDATSFALRWVK